MLSDLLDPKFIVHAVVEDVGRKDLFLPAEEIFWIVPVQEISKTFIGVDLCI